MCSKRAWRYSFNFGIKGITGLNIETITGRSNLMRVLIMLIVVLFVQVAGAAEREIHAKEFGDNWLLAVRKGTVACERIQPSGYSGTPLYVVTFYAPGLQKKFALNGTAMSRGYERIDDIWLDSGNLGLKMSISPVLDAGLALYDQ